MMFVDSSIKLIQILYTNYCAAIPLEFSECPHQIWWLLLILSVLILIRDNFNESSSYLFWISRVMIAFEPHHEKIMPYVNNKAADQPEHPHSLISAFVFAA